MSLAQTKPCNRLESSESEGKGASEFCRLLDEVREGSQAAAWKLLETYGPHVERVVSRMLGPQMRSKFDSADFAQAVWLSFFRNRAKILEFTEPQQLVAFLARVARNKVHTEIRTRVYTGKHDIRRERSLHEVDHGQLRTNDKSASHFLIAREEWDRLLKSQSERNRVILELKFLGKTNKFIASELGLNERTIRRVLEQVLPTFDS